MRKIVIMVNCFEQFGGYIGVEAHAVLQPLAESHEDLYDVNDRSFFCQGVRLWQRT